MLYDFSQFDGLRPEQIAQFATFRFRDQVENPTRLGERILPWVPRDDWQVEVGRMKFRPVASSVIGPDSPLPRGPLGTLDQRTYNIVKTGLKYEMNESEIKKLREIFNPGANIDATELLARSRPYQLADALVTGYLDLAEAQRWEVLTTGELVLPNSGGLKVDYGFDGDHQIALTSTDSWDEPTTADGLADLLEWDQILYDENGVHSSFTVMSRTALANLLAQNATATRLANAGFAGIGGQVAPNANQLGMPFFIDNINGYLARYGVGPIVLYDRQYRKQNPYGGDGQTTDTRFLAEDHFVMVSPTPIDGGLGFDQGTATGFQADGPVVENRFEPGIYVWLAEKDEPYEVAVKSVGWTLPMVTDPRTLVSGDLW